MDPNDTRNRETIDLPKPTGWPILTAFGITLLVAGLVTSLAVTAVGLVTTVIAGIGWFFDIFPHPKHEPVELVHPSQRPLPQIPRERMVDYLKVGVKGHRVRIPAEVNSYSSGILGGLAGGAVMAILAVMYGVWKQHSIWYTVNLLAAAAMPSMADASMQTLCTFQLWPFIIAVIAHLSVSIMVGLLYAVILPMLPRRFEWFWGGIFTPLLWTVLIYASIDVVNPKLALLIDWPWFIFCQIAFGAVGGFVVYKSEKVETMQTWPLAAKIGVEAPQREEDR